MTLHGRETPSWVAAVLGWPLFKLTARLALTSAYWVGGFTKLLDFQGAMSEQRHFGLEPAGLLAVLTIAVELLGSACVVSGRWVWLGAGALGIFTLLANMVANAFWNMQGAVRFAAMNGFFEHLGLVGGFMLVAVALQQEGEQRARS